MKKNKGEVLFKANSGLVKLQKFQNYRYYGPIIFIVGAILIGNNFPVGIWMASLGGTIWFIGTIAKLLFNLAEAILDGLDGNTFDVDIYADDIAND